MTNTKDMEAIITTMNHAADLTTKWGQTILWDRKTLSDVLTISGVPLWELFSPEMSHTYVLNALTGGSRHSWFRQNLRPYLARVKHAVLDPFRYPRSANECVNWPSEPAFLFLGFSAYIYRDVLEPIVERINGRKDVRPVVLQDWGNVEANAFLDDRQVFQSIWGHWDTEVGKRIRTLRKALRKAIAELKSSNALPETFVDNDRSLWPRLKGTFRWYSQVVYPLLLRHAAIAEHILTRHRPALIISPDVSDPRTRLYCMIGRRLGIKSLQIQMAEYNNANVEWRFFSADRLAVWGETARQVMLYHGVPDDRIEITGSSRHDELIIESREETVKTRSRFGVGSGDTMVLFASVYSFKEHDGISNIKIIESIKNSIFQAANRLKKIRFVVKPHPLEDVAELKRLAGNRSNVHITDPRENIRDMIKACDVFVAATGSTTIWDALVANKLTILPVFSGWAWSHRFAGSGAVLTPSSPEEVAECLQDAVDPDSRDRLQSELEPARQRFLNQSIHALDGHATARIEELACNMAYGE